MKPPLPALLLLITLLPACDDSTPAGTQSPTAELSPQEMYERGRALLKPNVEHNASDFAQALSWTRKAAESGWLQAQTDLGALFMYGGKGIEVNGAEALKWFTRAAEQGSREAELFIGDLYKHGIGIEADADEAMKHWRIAAEAGISEAQQRLGHNMVQYPATFSEGIEWLKRAATQGSARGKADAATDLGTLYAKGLGGVKMDMTEAARWYAIGAEEGNAQAQLIYAVMLLMGESIPQDEKAGVFMLRRSASQDYIPAMEFFVRYLRVQPDATPEQLQEAEAWSKRLHELQMKRRGHTPQPPQGSAEGAR